MDWIVRLKIFNPYNLTQLTFEKLMEHLLDYCNDNLVDHLNDTEYLKKIEDEVSNYTNPYAIYDDIDFNRLI